MADDTPPKDGFVRVPHTLIDSGILSAQEFMVYLSLLRHRSHRTGKCWPGLAVIAKESRLSRRTAIRAIKALEDVGAVVVFRSQNQANRYTVVPFQKWVQCQPGTSATESLVPDSHPTSATESLPLVPESHPASATESPEQELRTRTSNENQEVDTPAPAYSADFLDWYARYPRHEGKRNAAKAYERARKRATIEQLNAGAERYAADPNRKPKFTKHPATWLNGDCWDDAPLPSEKVSHADPLRIEWDELKVDQPTTRQIGA